MSIIFKLNVMPCNYCFQETAIKDRIQEKLGRQLSKGIIAGLVQEPVTA
jgi:hypothetical protein